MLRRLFTLLTALSFVLCLLVIAGWVASYSDWGGFNWERHVWTTGVRPASFGHWPAEINGNGTRSLDDIADVEDKDGAFVGTVDGAFYVIRDQWRTTAAHGDGFDRQNDLSLRYSWPRHMGLYFGTNALPPVEERRVGFAVRFGDGRDGRYMTHLVIPCWALFILTAALPGVSTASAARRRGRGARGECLRCGYDLRATPGRCPECGTMVTETQIPN